MPPIVFSAPHYTELYQNTILKYFNTLMPKPALLPTGQALNINSLYVDYDNIYDIIDNRRFNAIQQNNVKDDRDLTRIIDTIQNANDYDTYINNKKDFLSDLFTEIILQNTTNESLLRQNQNVATLIDDIKAIFRSIIDENINTKINGISQAFQNNTRAAFDHKTKNRYSTYPDSEFVGLHIESASNLGRRIACFVLVDIEYTLFFLQNILHDILTYTSDKNIIFVDLQNITICNDGYPNIDKFVMISFINKFIKTKYNNTSIIFVTNDVHFNESFYINKDEYYNFYLLSSKSRGNEIDDYYMIFLALIIKYHNYFETIIEKLISKIIADINNLDASMIVNTNNQFCGFLTYDKFQWASGIIIRFQNNMIRYEIDNNFNFKILKDETQDCSLNPYSFLLNADSQMNFYRNQAAQQAAAQQAAAQQAAAQQAAAQKAAAQQAAELKAREAAELAARQVALAAREARQEAARQAEEAARQVALAFRKRGSNNRTNQSSQRRRGGGLKKSKKYISKSKSKKHISKSKSKKTKKYNKKTNSKTKKHSRKH
jgi:hypothetical protein